MPPVADIQTSPWETDQGVRLAESGVAFGSGPDDPSVAGVSANVGDYWYRTNGEVWRKTGATDTDWTLTGSGGGAVDSVNGQTGVVVLESDDIPFDNSGSDLLSGDAGAAIKEVNDKVNRQPDIVLMQVFT